MARPTDGQAWPRVTPGVDGDPGAPGTNGAGLPTGGTTGQVPKKNSNTNFDIGWADESGGTIALDDVTDVNAPSPADGDVLTFDSGSGDWIPSAPTGGGGGTKFPDPAPGSPSAYDDEFTAGTLDAKWTEANSPHGSFTKFANKYSDHWGMEGDGNATAVYTIREAMSGFAAGTAFQVTAKVSLGWKSGNSDPQVGVTLSDNSSHLTGNYTILFLTITSSEIQVLEYNGSVNLTVSTGRLRMGMTMYLHIQRDTGNTVRYYISEDGLTWFLAGSASRAFSFDFLYVYAKGGASSSNPARILVDWVRVNDARFTQPV
jgi:hypothetical protein